MSLFANFNIWISFNWFHFLIMCYIFLPVYKPDHFFYWTLDSEIFTLLGIGYFCNTIFWNFVLEYIYITEIQFNKFSHAWRSPKGSGLVLSPELIIPPNLSKSLPTMLWMVFQPENFVWLMENNLSIILHELQKVFLLFFAGGSFLPHIVLTHSHWWGLW